MLSRTLPTTLLQIYCEVVLNSKVIIKSIEDQDNNKQVEELLSINGLNTPVSWSESPFYLLKTQLGNAR